MACKVISSACSTVTGLIFMHETTWVLILLCSLLAQFASSVPSNPVDLEDNEFAEFEDFDEGDYAGAAHAGGSPDPGKGNIRDSGGGGDGAGGVPSGGGGSQKPVSAADEEEEEDRDVRGRGGGVLLDRDEFMDDEEEDEGQVEDEEGDEFEPDEEEFENINAGGGGGGPSGGGRRDAGGPTPDAQPQKLQITDVPAHLRNNWLNFQVEIVTLIGLAIYLANYVMGKTKNQSLATAWFEMHKEQLEANFHIVGDDGREKDKPSAGVLMKESDSVFSLWCTGRHGCDGMLVQIKLLKRQDLVNTITRLVKPQYDQVVIKVSMTPDDMDTFVCAVGKKKTLQKVAKDMTDLSQYCTEKKTAENIGLPSSMTILTEIGEATAAVLDPKVVATISKYEESFDYLHFSDQFSGPKPQETDQPKVLEAEHVLIFSFNIPGKSACSERHIESIRPMLNLVFYMIDKVKRFRLTREFKLKAERNRQRVAASYLKTTHAVRQEAAQQRKEDKIRERKERILTEEDPERQKRLEKQEAKREAKRNQPRMKQLKVKGM